MAHPTVGLLGKTLRQRSEAGLEAALGYYAPTRQAFHVHERPSLSVLVTGRGTDRSRRQDYLQPPLTAVFHSTSEPHANEIGPGGVLGFTLSFDTRWLELHELAEKDLGGHRILPDSVWWRLRMLRALGLAFARGPTAAADLETLVAETLASFAAPMSMASCQRPPGLRLGDFA
jgi:hypothetical protein